MVAEKTEHPLFTGIVEVLPTFRARPKIEHVLFDFDGTLSLIRHGWSDVMVSLFCEMLPPVDGESPESMKQLVLDDIMGLNGKQTIYQMIQFADRVRQRGGSPEEPLWYKHEYLRRLNLMIEDRLVGLRSGAIPPERYLVYGARALLERLSQMGMTLHLASGTDIGFVKEEASLLGIAHFFEGRISGAVDDFKSFSKKIVIDRILAENGICGNRLLAFGDGYVEIQNTKEVGGLAVAVASDEVNHGSGRIDEWKRQRLIAVGADIVIPDYRDAMALVDYLVGAS